MTKSGTKFGVLFVCTGNICRSPAAEGVFRHYAAREGRREHFLIDSAGTHDYHVGEPPDPRTIAAGRARGISMDDLRARQFRREDFDDFDLIVAMDDGHHRLLGALAPAQSRGTLARFVDFMPAGSGLTGVPDPYYGGPADFERVMDIVEAGVNGLMQELCRKLAL